MLIEDAELRNKIADLYITAHDLYLKLEEVHLSVERDNEPSVKTIVKNGGKYERSFEFEGEEADIYKIVL